MGRRKLNLLERILIIIKYINKKEMKEIRGIDCEFCKNQDFTKVSEKKTVIKDKGFLYEYEYICKKCGATIYETQEHLIKKT